MNMELLSYGNLPLTVILKSVGVISDFLGEKQENFMLKIGLNNKKLYSKMRVMQLGEWKESLERFKRIYESMKLNECYPVEEKINCSRNPNIIEEIRTILHNIYTKYKTKQNIKETTEILVNILIPKDKWLELNSSNISKMINFYYNRIGQNLTVDSFERFILSNKNYSKYYSFLSKKIKTYYEERILTEIYKRKDVYEAQIFKPKYEEIFKSF